MQQYLKTYKTLEKIGCLYTKSVGTKIGGYQYAYVLSVLQNETSYKSYTFDKNLHVRLGLQKPINIVGASIQLVCSPQPVTHSCVENKLRLCLAAADLYRRVNTIDHHFLGCVFLGSGRKPLFIHSDEFTPAGTNAAHTGIRVLRRSYSPKPVGTCRTPYWKAVLILARFGQSSTARVAGIV